MGKLAGSLARGLIEAGQIIGATIVSLFDPPVTELEMAKGAFDERVDRKANEAYEDAIRRGNSQTEAQVAADMARENALKSNSGPLSRPTWQESERDILNNPGHKSSFLNGVEVSIGTKGSSIPDEVDIPLGLSREVKSYNLSTRRGVRSLIHNVTRQALDRRYNLPNTFKKTVVIDYRGQTVPPELKQEIAEKIEQDSLGAIDQNDVTFFE